MTLEVANDQFDKAVQIMRVHISNGMVSGVTDINMAEQIAIKVHYTS